MRKFFLGLVGLTLAGMSTAAEARDQIQIVGSSTVFPFSTYVAERFANTSVHKTPVVEPTGTGGGMKLFCRGLGVGTPDITNASRAIKKSEIKTCYENGVNKIIEVKFGYDGIVVANSKKAPVMDVTRQQVFLALAKEIPNPDGSETLVANPHKMWSDVDASLPKAKIEVLGPPPTSGTRDAFTELVLDHGCSQYAFIKAFKKKDKSKFRSICRSIREDGAYVEAGENDNLIVQKLESNSDAFGIFGYSFLDQNIDKVQGARIEGTMPTFDNIANGSYPVSRPLFFYVKKAHVGKINGIREFLAEFTSNKAWGEEGYLTDKGLIPMPLAERKSYGEDVAKLRVNVAD